MPSDESKGSQLDAIGSLAQRQLDNTAMYYTFLAPDKPLPHRTNRYLYFLHVDRFMDDSPEEAFSYDWTRKGLKILDDRDVQFELHYFPLSVVGKGGWELPNWVQDYEKYWRVKEQEATEAKEAAEAKQAAQHAENAVGFGERIKGITQEYQVAYIELDRDLAIDKVCDIFTQINSRGVQLDIFDLINALLKPKGLRLKHMWREAKSRLEFVESNKLNVYILQVMSILRQNYCSPKYLYYLLPGQEKQVRDPDGTRRTEVLIPDITDFERRWSAAVDAIEDAVRLLRHPQEFGAISSNYLPYVSILPVFSALQSHVKTLPANRRLDAQRKIRRWYWASVFTARYSGSVESTSARDFLDVKEWINEPTAEPSLWLEFKNRFKNLELRKETKRGTSVYNGIFNLLVLQGARDWMSGNVPQHGDLDGHHIVPASWGSKNLKGDTIHRILNRHTVDSRDQPKRHSRPATQRVSTRAYPNRTTKKEVRKILESHSISPVAQEILLRDPFALDDFEAFISERQRTLQDTMENLLVKERLDLPPQLRELDERIELTELDLRKIINDVLAGEFDGLPPHVVQKVDERIQRALKKSAARESDDYATLPGKLEFCDLRELQDIITSRSLWPQFSERFSNKETLVGKFGQLAVYWFSVKMTARLDVNATPGGRMSPIAPGIVPECSGASRVKRAARAGFAALDAPCALWYSMLVGERERSGAPGIRVFMRAPCSHGAHAAASEPARVCGLAPTRSGWPCHP